MQSFSYGKETSAERQVSLPVMEKKTGPSSVTDS